MLDPDFGSGPAERSSGGVSDQPSSTRARRRTNPDQREPELAVIRARPDAEAGETRAPEAATAGREITLPGLVTTLRRGLWLLAATALVCVLIAAVALKLREPVYTAVMVVAPAERDVGAVSRLAADLEQYASLATLAQTPARLEQVSTIERYVELIGSVPLAERLDREHQLLKHIFASQWDEAREAWQPPPGAGAAAKRQVLEFFGFPGWTAPTPASLAEFLTANVTVSRQATTALRRLSFAYPDPDFAASLLSAVHVAADDMLRSEALARVRQQIQHLEQELAGSARAEHEAALQAMLAEQYRAEALLAADLPFAAQVVSPPAASATPSSMSPLLVLALAAVVGVIAGIFVVFLRDALRSAPA